MRVTVDTNVIYSAFYSKSGASNFILKLIVNDKIELALSPQIYFEYYDLLTRKDKLEKLNLSIKNIEDILDLLALLAKKHEIYFLLRPNLPDEADNMFVECAFASNSDYLITSNVKHFKRTELGGFKFRIITPKDFYKTWRDKYE